MPLHEQHDLAHHTCPEHRRDYCALQQLLRVHLNSGIAWVFPFVPGWDGLVAGRGLVVKHNGCLCGFTVGSPI
jgi:hypothetical protein